MVTGANGFVCRRVCREPVSAASSASAAILAGRRLNRGRLGGSQELVRGKVAARLNLQPPLRLEEELAATAAWYRRSLPKARNHG